jgi:hypothetical protein
MIREIVLSVRFFSLYQSLGEARDLPITEPLSRLREFSQFMSDHLVRDRDRNVILSIMYHESQSYERRQDSRCSTFCEDWSIVLERIGKVREGREEGS